MKYSMPTNKSAAGTCLQGETIVDYADLVKAFGKPNAQHDDYKSDAEWVVEFADGLIATIYNYKNGQNYNGRFAPDVTEISDWHIGGNDPRVVGRICRVLEA